MKETEKLNGGAYCRECGRPVPGLNPTGLCMACTWAEDDEPEGPETACRSGEFPEYLSNYRIHRMIARGGMGVVFEAEQLDLGRRVALKLMAPDLAGVEETQRRFRSEASSTARLKHPNIIDVYETGEEGGWHYISMELMQGGDLVQWTGEQPVGNREAAAMARQIAAGISHAHSHGIIHRDLKPRNVLLSADHTRIRIADFGIARSLNEHTHQTRTGAVLGSPSYMSPEQASGTPNRTGPATDIYSIGAILYFLLTGRPPFRAATPAETMRQVLYSEPASPRAVNPAVDEDLETICVKCLSKSPAQRYGSAAELADDLQRFLDGRTIVARPVTRIRKIGKWVRRNPLPAALASSLIVVSIAGFAATFHQLQRARLALIESNRLRIAEQTARAVTMPPAGMFEHESGVESARFMNGSDEVITASDDGVVRLWSPNPAGIWESIKMVGHSGIVADVLAIPGTEHIASFSWDPQTRKPSLSPEGQPVFVTSSHRYGDRTVRVWNRNDGREIHRFDAGTQVSDMSVSQDGRFIAVACWDGSLKLLDADDASILFDTNLFRGAVRSVEWYPGGQSLLVTPEGHQYSITMTPTSSGGSSMSVTEDSIALKVSATDGTVEARFKKHARGLSWLGGGGSSTAIGKVSPDGRLVATGGDDTGGPDLWNARTGKLKHRLNGHAHSIIQLAFSPDSRWLASAGADHTAKIWNTASGELVSTLSGHHGPVTDICFSPDGTWVATASDDGSARVWDPATGRGISVFLDHGSRVNSVEFSSNGYDVLTASNDGTAALFSAAHLDTLSRPITVDADNGLPEAIHFSDDSRFVGVSTSYGKCLTFDISNEEPLHALEPEVRSALKPEWQRLLYRDVLNFTIDGSTRKAVTLTGYTKFSTSRQFLPFTKESVTEYKFSPLILWDLKHGREIPLLADMPEQTGFSAMDWHRGTDTVAAGTRMKIEAKTVRRDLLSSGFRSYTAKTFNSPTLVLWSSTDGRRLHQLEENSREIELLRFTPDGKHLITNDGNQTRIRAVEKPDEPHILTGVPSYIQDISFFPGGSKAMMYGGGRVEIVDLLKKQKEEDFELNQWVRAVRRSVLTPDGGRILCTEDSEGVHLCDSRTGKIIKTWRDSRTPCGDVCISPAGDYAAVVGNEKTILVYNLNTLELVEKLHAHTREVVDLEFSPDSQWLASASRDGSIRLWPCSRMKK